MDQFRAIRVFVRIAEAGNFVKAAESLDISSPSVTKLIQALELHLGVKLLHRTTRRVTLTPEGAAYYERAVPLIAELDDLDTSLAEAKGKPRGRLRVQVGSSVANLILIPKLPLFCQLFPDIQLDIEVTERSAAIGGHGVDCIIHGGPIEDLTFVVRPLAQLSYTTVASPSYVKEFGVPCHPLDLQRGHQLLGYCSSQTRRTHPLYFERDEQHHRIVGNVPVTVSDTTAHLTALLTGMGIGQTFRFMAKPYLDKGALLPALADWHRAKYPLSVVYPSNRHLNSKRHVFVDWLADVFSPFSR